MFAGCAKSIPKIYVFFEGRKVRLAIDRANLPDPSSYSSSSLPTPFPYSS